MSLKWYSNHLYINPFSYLLPYSQFFPPDNTLEVKSRETDHVMCIIIIWTSKACNRPYYFFNSHTTKTPTVLKEPLKGQNPPDPRKFLCISFISIYASWLYPTTVFLFSEHFVGCLGNLFCFLYIVWFPFKWQVLCTRSIGEAAWKHLVIRIPCLCDLGTLDIVQSIIVLCNRNPSSVLSLINANLFMVTGTLTAWYGTLCPTLECCFLCWGETEDDCLWRIGIYLYVLTGLTGTTLKWILK